VPFLKYVTELDEVGINESEPEVASKGRRWPWTRGESSAVDGERERTNSRTQFRVKLPRKINNVPDVTPH
jgi:hypothetical protein